MKYTLRIKKNKVFKYIFKKGNYAKGTFIVLHCCPTKKSTKEEDSMNFFAVCVSKKNGNSVQRNRLKRLAREVYKQEEEKLKKGYNYIISYKKETSAENVDFELIRNDIIKCLKELNLYE